MSALASVSAVADVAKSAFIRGMRQRVVGQLEPPFESSKAAISVSDQT
jgi:hypothetical protein